VNNLSSMRPLVVASALVALALASGCEKNRARDDARANAPETTATATTTGEAAATTGGARSPAPPKETAPAPEVKPSIADAMKEAKGSACFNDQGCPGYLRCLGDKVCTVPPAMTGKHDEKTPVVTFTGADGKEIARYYSELAVNNPERMRGLMYRPTMKQDWGMLFVYPPGDRDLSFWMKNTYIPLDMVFIDTGGKVVGIVKGAEPLTLGPRTPGKPSRFVLELVAGEAERAGIKPGMQMELLNAPRDDYKPLR